ncbi:MAG: hypothetical protein Q4D76_14385 [Oscillospiraceae bacterium]|nr:hypothetical protein [Oscillospiraceae bacterium]
MPAKTNSKTSAAFQIKSLEAINQKYLQQESPSVISYSRSLQQWADEIQKLLFEYQTSIKDQLKHCRNIIREYKLHFNNAPINSEEYYYLEQRQNSFAELLDISGYIRSAIVKVVSVKYRAEILEHRISSLDPSTDDYSAKISEICNEEKPDLTFVIDSITDEIKKAFSIADEYVRDSRFTENCMRICSLWTNDYLKFIENYAYQPFWKEVRDLAESKIYLVIEREFRKGFRVITADEITVSEKLIAELEVYKISVDKIFTEEKEERYPLYCSEYNNFRRAINYFHALNKCLSDFLNSIKDIFFECVNYDDRQFISDWVMDFYSLYKSLILQLCNRKIISEPQSAKLYSEIDKIDSDTGILNSLDEDEYADFILAREELITEILIHALNRYTSNAKGGYGLELI